MKQDLKVGDLVTIIPHEEHNKSVKENYDKVLKIKQVVKSNNCLLYKVGGIPNYALREDLKQLSKEKIRKTGNCPYCLSPNCNLRVSNFLGNRKRKE